MYKTKQFWYILLFALLYIITAGSSFYHAILFFGLANNSWMSIVLAFAFEIGQAAVLFSLLTSTKDRNRIVPWVLMLMFTVVQVVGNVFSSYKYLVLNSVEDLKYFKEPIFIWTQLPDQEATVIVTWAIGAILPVCALLLTSMITNYLSDQEELKKEQHIEKITNEIEDETEKDNNDDKEKDNEETDGNIDSPKEEVIVEDEKEPEKEEIEIPNDIKGTDPDDVVIGETGEGGSTYIKEKPIVYDLDEPEEEEAEAIEHNEEAKKKDPEKINDDEEQVKRESHFINL